MFVTAWVTVALMGELRRPSGSSGVSSTAAQALVSLLPPNEPPSEFDAPVMQALDQICRTSSASCSSTRRRWSPVAVTSTLPYGHYIGGTIALDIYPDRSSSTRTRWSATSATIQSCSERRSSALCATSRLTTWATVNAGYEEHSALAEGVRGARAGEVLQESGDDRAHLAEPLQGHERDRVGVGVRQRAHGRVAWR